jgi:hypothetical protein
MAKSAERKAEQRRQSNATTARRRRWERGDTPPSPGSKYPGVGGRERMTTAVDVERQQREDFIRSNPEMYPGRDLERQPVRPMAAAQVYESRGIPGQHTNDQGRFFDVGTGVMQPQQQIPGLENPYEAKQPPRWEDIPPEKQRDIEGRVRARTGATMESMTRSIGAQVDQAHLRGEKHGKLPSAHDFYIDGEPHQVIKEGAEKLGVDFGVLAAMNALTSPNTKFHVRHPVTGADTYPNNEIAMSAVEQARRLGGYAEEKAYPPSTLAGTGYPKNFRKAAGVFHDLDSGTPLRETAGMGPKTGAYHNAWQPDIPGYFVSDVHSGGGGALPHLSGEKPYKRTEDGDFVVTSGGQKAKIKSERERGLEVAGIHSMIDHAARTAMNERGLTSMRETQAVQWQEERIQRGIVHEEHAYGDQPYHEQNSKQMQFSGFEDERTGSAHRIRR